VRLALFLAALAAFFASFISAGIMGMEGVRRGEGPPLALGLPLPGEEDSDTWRDEEDESAATIVVEEAAAAGAEGTSRDEPQLFLNLLFRCCSAVPGVTGDTGDAGTLPPPVCVIGESGDKARLPRPKPSPGACSEPPDDRDRLNMGGIEMEKPGEEGLSVPSRVLRRLPISLPPPLFVVPATASADTGWGWGWGWGWEAGGGTPGRVGELSGESLNALDMLGIPALFAPVAAPTGVSGLAGVKLTIGTDVGGAAAESG
jgi:hypothetical protein